MVWRSRAASVAIEPEAIAATACWLGSAESAAACYQPTAWIVHSQIGQHTDPTRTCTSPPMLARPSPKPRARSCLARLGQERLQLVSANRTAIRPVDCEGLISHRPRAIDCEADGCVTRRHFMREDGHVPHAAGRYSIFPSAHAPPWNAARRERNRPSAIDAPQRRWCRPGRAGRVASACRPGRTFATIAQDTGCSAGWGKNASQDRRSFRTGPREAQGRRGPSGYCGAFGFQALYPILGGTLFRARGLFINPRFSHQ